MAVSRNNAVSRLAARHMVGDDTLVLASGEGARFGDPTADAPIRVTVAARSTLVNGQIAPTSTQTIFDVTTRTDDTLSGLTVAEGTADQNFGRNDPVASLITWDLIQGLAAGGGNPDAVLTTEEYEDPEWLRTLAPEKVVGLPDALDAKADDDSVVKLIGEQAIGTNLAVLPIGATTGGTLASRYANRHDCKNDHGATGDGVTDDFAACAAAITAAGVGGTVYFPPGVYKLSQALTPLSDQTILGEGWGKSIVKLDSSINAFGPLNINGVSRVLIEGIYFYGSPIAQQGVVTFNNATDCAMVNCRTSNGWYGTLIRSNSLRISVANCIIEATYGGQGLEINGSNGCAVEGCTITASAAAANGMEIYQHLNDGPLLEARITNNNITAANGAGIKMCGVQQSVVANNVIHDCFQSGITIVEGEQNTNISSCNLTIMGNIIDNCGAVETSRLPGIYLVHNLPETVLPCYGIAINGNVVTRSGSVGIAADSCKFIQILGNVVSLNYSGGMSITHGSDYLISNNLIYDNGVNGSQGGVILDTATNCTIQGNRIGNLVPANSNQYWGVILLNTNSDITVTANNLVGNRGPGFIDNSGTATNLIVRNNAGYTTSADGTATVASGQTSVTIAHGLARAPTLKNITVTPTNLPTNNVRWYVSAVTGTNLTITTSGDPGAGGATFAWRADVL